MRSMPAMSESPGPAHPPADPRDRLRGLLDAVIAVGADLSLPDVLRRIVASACTLEANSASSSSKDVRISTAVPGSAARTSRHTSMPEPSGSCTSSRTTSGAIAGMRRTASAAVDASPTTSMPVVSSSSRSPRRTLSWSSTRTTRTRRVPMRPSVRGTVRRHRLRLPFGTFVPGRTGTLGPSGRGPSGAACPP